VTGVRQLIIGVQYDPKVISTRTVVDYPRLSGHDRRREVLTLYASAQNFNRGGGLIGGFPRNLKVNLLLAIHVVDREQWGR
jgi:hypothetical protein